ncbi:ADP-ribosylation factor GTPase-activating protein AGD5-like isoform X2 [Tripterygium wilfordii]|nr:ADP-ribosylation factor GTPase-activating protein AGD5-like isoform X2 [Tripterygium wilfordii]XP_038690266.1 ADP-ribosylation factor GTPase-activating protein AGD5-like isoform X2 [Tripterygium wilfordii]
MGNEKSNSYWEAELPPNYDRVGIENFIRAKYEEKRWVSKDGKPNSLPRGQDERASVHSQRPGERSGHGYASNPENSYEERKNLHTPNVKDSVPATKISMPAPPRGPNQVAPVSKPQQAVETTDSLVAPAEVTKKAADAASAVSHPKVDLATDLFNMLSFDSPSENGSEAAPTDDNSWAGFQSASAEDASPAENASPAKAVENNTRSTSAIEDLFKDTPLFTTTPVAEKPQKDVKNDIMSLFEKSNMVSPFSLHQQQLAMLAQQQSLLMAAAAKSAVGDPKLSGKIQQPGSNGVNMPTQNWPNIGYQIPGMMMPVGGTAELQKLMQASNMGQAYSTGTSVELPTSSFYSMGQVTQSNVVGNNAVNATQPAPPILSASPSPSQSAKDYDFSSLTQGFFSKH